jgi:hypothetical protein
VIDKKVIACNYRVATKTASEGALAYFFGGWRGGGYERVQILLRSRGGRWIKKWESIKRLDNFRLKTIPPEHPRYKDVVLLDGWAGLETELQELCEYYRAGGK